MSRAQEVHAIRAQSPRIARWFHVFWYFGTGCKIRNEMGFETASVITSPSGADAGKLEAIAYTYVASYQSSAAPSYYCSLPSKQHPGKPGTAKVSEELCPTTIF